jgi:hypothetical protein
VDGLPTNLELDPSSDDIVYVGTNGYGVFKTTSGGRDWEAASNGLATPFIKGPDALLVHPGKPQTVFAATQSGGIYKSTDGARTWTATGPAGVFAFGMAVDPFNPSRIIVACAEKKLLLSENEGMTWRELRLPGKAPPHISAFAVAFHPGRQGEIYAGTLAYDCKAADGLFASHDGGRTFQSIALDVPQVSINDICISGGAQSTVYLGFNGTGLYRADAPH